jgi:hypothetical protein
MSGTFGHYDELPPTDDPVTARSAALTVTDHIQDPREARKVLDALGLTRLAGRGTGTSLAAREVAV